ncbi:GAF and ANTAR domain-containing protein [Nonomuraea sp. NPDC049419]|uniref:GAF and ANTAR domain-containing protein n=1 Tax=Nonomuraea sp. NPDC049419 TaxID=3155772 RepID=UPI003443509D
MAERAGVPTDIAEFEQALAECVAIAGRAMPDSPMLSIVLCRDGEIPTVACSDGVAELLDGLQRATGQGPVLDVIRDGGPVTSDDLRAESRWPRFSAAAGQVRGVHCEPLESAGVLLGVLTLYASRPGGFADETWTAMRVTAAHVGVLFRAALDVARMREVAGQLKEALTTRGVIDQALGIVMAQRRCTARQAFELLRQISQDRNVKVHQIAAAIVEKVSGEPARRSRFEEPPQKTSG